MPGRWQVWGHPDGRQVWIPAPDPYAPPPLPPPGRAAASFEDAPVKGPGAADGCRVESMADLLVQARNKLLEGDGMGAGATVDAGKGELFRTGSGRPVSVSERAISRARALVGEEVEKAGIKTKQRFGDVPDVDGELREMDAPFRGGVHNTTMPPLFQTGSGKAVLLRKNSIQKARVILEDSEHGDSSVCATTLQSETPRSVLMSSSLIMNSRSVTPNGDTAMQDKIHENGDHLPLFQTGLGRSIAISKSSVKRATAVLEPRNIAKELEDEAHLNGGHDTPVFKTGLGRSILASDDCRNELCLSEAQEAVQSVNNYNGETFVEEAAFQAGIQKFVPQNRSSSPKASMHLEQRNFTEKGYEDSGAQLPMFRTGSGKSVLISESSVQKARGVLEEEVKINKDNHNLLNMDKKIHVFASPLKTSCARTVNISSVGVSRAATLLGLEENTLSTQFFGHVGDKLGTKINFERRNPEERLGFVSCPTENQVYKEPHRPFELSNSTVSDSGEHSIRFRTGGGRSMAISSDALQRARSLLGESDLAVSTNNLVGHSLTSACNVEMPNSTVAPKGGPDLSKISRFDGKSEITALSHQAMSDRKHTGSFGNAVTDIPESSKYTNMFHVRSRSISEIRNITKPPSMCLSETDNANDMKPPSMCLSETNNANGTKDKTRRQHMPAGVLVDISNSMGAHSGNIDHGVNEKRRMGGRNSTPSFKRPRSSRPFDLHPC